MGFFSSKKEDNDASVPYTPKKEDKSVVQAIRSRFHGKKGKEREDTKVSRVAPSPIPFVSSPLAGNKHHTRTIISVPSFRQTNLDRTPPTIRLSHERAPPVEPLPVPETTRSSKSPPHTHQASGPSTSVVARKTTDSVTVTLAQRLNELASANSEGLLSDDEYRILRQSLFERFASNATVPREASVVPVSSSLPTSPEPSSRHLSNLQIDRPPSIVSKSSGTSNAHNLLRLVTDRRPNTNDKSDTSSLMSTKSNTSLFKMPRLLSRKASNSSVRTTASRAQTDAISVSSRRISLDKGRGDYSLTPSTPRSAAGSIRRMPVPPSSFNARIISQARHSAIYNVFDENHLTTVQDIQQEISNVESEQKRLMDAFNGLELTTLARRQRVAPSKRSIEFTKFTRVADSIWGDSDGRSQRHNLTDDGISLRSGTSAGTSPSMARSGHGLRAKISGTGHSLPALPLFRKSSMSSVDDRRTPIPHLSSSAASQGYLQSASKSNISLHSRGSRVATTEDDKPTSAVHIDVHDSLEGELEDIRRRREEVNHRYEARLEYLRAKLKGAQLHEKLMRR